MARRPFFKAASTVAGILILAAGCAEMSPTAIQVDQPTLAAGSAQQGPRANVVQTVFTAGSYATTIGPQGGTIDFGIGSLDRPTRISATTDGQNIGVTFAPHGLQFPAGAEPVLKLVPLSASATSNLRIVYVNAAGYVLEEVATNHDIEGNHLTAQLRHFSTYWMAAP
jgi:hypothetical protein